MEHTSVIDFAGNGSFFQGQPLLLTFFLAALLACSVLVSSIEPAMAYILAKKNMQGHGEHWYARLVKRYLSRRKRVRTITSFVSIILNLGIVFTSIGLLSVNLEYRVGGGVELFVGVMVSLLLILASNHVLPSHIAYRCPAFIVNTMAIPLLVSDVILWPVVDAIERITNASTRRDQQFQLSINDISHAIDITDTHSISAEKDLLEGIVKLKTTDVKMIMKSRVDVVAVPITASYESLKNTIIENVFSRIPIYDGSFDNIKGILFVKDLIPHMGKATFNWQTLIRPPYFIPQSKRIDDLLEEFQKRKVHMAFIIDEYGGTLGIVTLEDILEEIVGEINDEFDEDSQDFVKVDENTFLCEGKLALNDFLKHIDTDESFLEGRQGEAETIAGFILELKGDFPALNEEIEFKQLKFKIEAEDQRRIKKIRVTINSHDNVELQ